MRSVDVFFYGLFMDREALAAQGFQPAAARLAMVRDFALRIAARATLVPQTGGVAWGFVIALPADQVRQLYSGPSVDTYTPEAVLAEFTDGTSLPALCYNLMEVETAPPNRDYAARLAKLGRRLGLPVDYVAELENLAR